MHGQKKTAAAYVDHVLGHHAGRHDCGETCWTAAPVHRVLLQRPGGHDLHHAIVSFSNLTQYMFAVLLPFFVTTCQQSQHALTELSDQDAPPAHARCLLLVWSVSVACSCSGVQLYCATSYLPLIKTAEHGYSMRLHHSLCLKEYVQPYEYIYKKIAELHFTAYQKQDALPRCNLDLVCRCIRGGCWLERGQDRGLQPAA